MLRSALCFTLVLSALHAQTPAGRGGRGGGAGGGAVPSIEERTAGMHKLDGYFPLYWDERTGNLWLEIPRFDTISCSPPGSPPDSGRTISAWTAGQEGGGKVGLVPARRAEGAAGAGQRIVPLVERQSRPSGDRWRIRSPSRCCGDSRWRPRATAMCWWMPPISSCAMAAARRARLRPGTYRVDRTRSAVYMARTKAFPKNTEIEVTLTFANEAAGRRRRRRRTGAGTTADQVRRAGGRTPEAGGFGGGLFSGTVASVTPTAEAVTLREHYSLVELPDDNYQAAPGRSARGLWRPRTSWTTARPSANPWCSATFTAIAWRRRIPPRPSATR